MLYQNIPHVEQNMTCLTYDIGLGLSLGEFWPIISWHPPVTIFFFTFYKGVGSGTVSYFGGNSVFSYLDVCILYVVNKYNEV